jgi:hypothetical protein
MGIIKIYHDKKWTLQFLDALYNSIDIDILSKLCRILELVISLNNSLFDREICISHKVIK